MSHWQPNQSNPLPTFIQQSLTSPAPTSQQPQYYNSYQQTTTPSSPQFNLDPTQYIQDYSSTNNAYYVPSDNSSSFMNYANYNYNYTSQNTGAQPSYQSSLDSQYYSSNLPNYNNYSTQVPQVPQYGDVYNPQTQPAQTSSPSNSQNYQTQSYPANNLYQQVVVNDQNYYVGTQQTYQQPQPQQQQQYQQNEQQYQPQQQQQHQPQQQQQQTTSNSTKLDEVEGWLWQLNENNEWKQLYFILDHDSGKLLGFTSYPQAGANNTPCQILRLAHPLQISDHFPYVTPIAGFCFGIIKPNTSNYNEYFVFDTINDFDRSRWVAWFRYYTKEVAAQAWLPWQSEENEKLTHIEKERERQLKEEEERLKRQKEEEIKQAMTRVDEQHFDELRNQNPDYYEAVKMRDNVQSQIDQITLQLNELKESKTSLLQSLSQYQQYLPTITDPQTKYQYESYITYYQNDLQQKDSLIHQKESELTDLQSKLNINNSNVVSSQSSMNSNNHLMNNNDRISIDANERERLIQEEREKIRKEIELQFEQSLNQKRKEEEEKWKMEKRALKSKILEKQSKQVLQWLDDNPAWRDYYRSLGVTESELSDPVFARNLIKNTAQFVLTSATPDVRIDSLLDSIPTPQRVPSQSTLPTPSLSSSSPSSLSDSSNIDLSLPPCPPPPVPTEDDHSIPHLPPPPPPAEMINQMPSQLPSVPSVPPPSIPSNPPPFMNEQITPPPPSVPSIPPPSFQTPSIPSMPPPNHLSSETSVPPPPPISAPTNAPAPPPPPPPMNISAAPALRIKPADPNKPSSIPPPMAKQESMMDQIAHFKFQKNVERKTVVQPKDLPAQDKQSLQAILSNRLASLRSVMKESADDDDDNNDAEWD